MVNSYESGPIVRIYSRAQKPGRKIVLLLRRTIEAYHDTNLQYRTQYIFMRDEIGILISRKETSSKHLGDCLNPSILQV